MKPADQGERIWQKFTADMLRYTGGEARPWSLGFLKRLAKAAYIHPGLLAVVAYRYGQWVMFRCRFPVWKQFHEFVYFCAFNWVRTRLQIEIPRHVAIEAGLRIDHFGGILVNSMVVAGKNLTLTQGVLIGQTDTGVPVLGDNVALGVGAKVIGAVLLGDNVLVGAAAVVTKSFPDNAVVAGVPARLLRFRAE